MFQRTIRGSSSSLFIGACVRSSFSSITYRLRNESTLIIPIAATRISKILASSNWILRFLSLIKKGKNNEETTRAINTDLDASCRIPTASITIAAPFTMRDLRLCRSIIPMLKIQLTALHPTTGKWHGYR